jgi:bifunctional DNase/RNase
MERNGAPLAIDSRPSDALALALRIDCPVFVHDEVLQTSQGQSAAKDPIDNEELRRWLENLNDEDLGRPKM